MSRRRPTWDEVLSAAQARLGATQGQDLADAIARFERGPEASASVAEVRRAYRWLDGKTTKNVDTLLLLLDAAGMLTTPANGQPQDVDELAERRRLTPGEEVAEQLRVQSALLETLTTMAETLTDVGEGLKGQIGALQDVAQELRGGRRPA